MGTKGSIWSFDSACCVRCIKGETANQAEHIFSKSHPLSGLFLLPQAPTFSNRNEDDTVPVLDMILIIFIKILTGLLIAPGIATVMPDRATFADAARTVFRVSFSTP